LRKMPLWSCGFGVHLLENRCSAASRGERVSRLAGDYRKRELLVMRRAEGVDALIWQEQNWRNSNFTGWKAEKGIDLPPLAVPGEGLCRT
jgi:hypothetical protein